MKTTLCGDCENDEVTEATVWYNKKYGYTQRTAR